jgi:site-specific DNA-cytosine methylase
MREQCIAFHPTQTPISSTDGSTHCLSQGCRGGAASVAVAFDTTQITSPGNYSVPKDGAPCHPLASGAHPPAVAFQPRIGRNGRGYSESAVPALNGADAGATSDMRPCIATPMAVRRLTPRECERLQGFPEWEKTAIVQLWQNKTNANVETQSGKSQQLVLSAESDASLRVVSCAVKSSPLNRPSDSKHAQINVLINLEDCVAEIRNHEKLVWSASIVEQTEQSAHVMAPGAFARLVASTITTLEHQIQSGLVENLKRERPLILAPIGKNSRHQYGVESAGSAKGAPLYTKDQSRCSMFTTLEVGQNFQSLDLSATTLLCSVLRAIASFTPAIIPNESLFNCAFTIRSCHTKIIWRGKPAEQCPDGPRYKALGNSMAVPCMAWIGGRIAAQDAEPLRYLSVCSGIEAASVAWEPLGWKAAAFAEVEKFPSAVLAHHWPDVPNLGDMTRFREWAEYFEDTDLLVGGTPCQAFSVAGLRRSLEDERGNLSLTYIHLLDEIDKARAAAGRPAAICVWENVPGVLSTKDNAFGCFLGALAGSGCALQPPGGRWANAGYVRGPKRQVAWRILDAQYFGVAQRRRRVFVVANAGDRISPSKVLFEQPCLRWNPPSRAEAGQGVASDAEGRAGDGRRGGHDVTGAIDCRIGAQRAQNAQAGHYVPAQAFTFSGYSNQPAWISGERTDCLPSSGHSDGSHQGIGVLQPITESEVVGTLSDGAHNGGGLNGQDAYTGRIFAVSRQPAHGADGQGNQHDPGRGPDGDCGGT